MHLDRFNPWKATLALFALTLMVIAGCSTRPHFYVKFEVLGPPEATSNVDVEFLSYDYVAVLDSLAQANNPGPRPDSSELLPLLDIYQVALEHSTAIADSVDFLRDDLEKLDNRSVDYRQKYPVFQELEKKQKSVADNLHQVHQQYLTAKSSYEAELAEWKQNAYKGFADFKEAIQPDFQTKVEVTGPDGMVKDIILPFGKWWLHSEIRRPGTTNEKLVWNLPLPETAETDSVMILLDESNANVIRELL